MKYSLFQIFGQEDPFYNLPMNPSDLNPEKSKVPDETGNYFYVFH